MQETIYALSSGAAPSGVAVVRVSGPGVRFGLETLIGRLPPARSAELCKIQSTSGDLIDRGLVLFFPGPRSFTGEDVAEYHIHGSRATIAAFLQALSVLPGHRAAEPGEFTRRAFEHGRMDLTAVEGLSDLIRAETEAQRKQALYQSEGGLRSLYDGWASRLTRARAMIEAELDFSDEEDIPGAVSDGIWPDMAELRSDIQAHLERAASARLIRNGFFIALVGAPNAGKSSLLNYLARRDVAIVSPRAGTTRDVVETRLDIGGHMVVVQDTAGIHDATDDIELEGIRRSQAAARNADMILTLQEPGQNTGDSIDKSRLDLDDEIPLVRLRSKSDLAEPGEQSPPGIDLAVSTVDGTGIDRLLQIIKDAVEARIPENNGGLPTRDRHTDYLAKCATDIGWALQSTEQPIEIRSEHLRRASEFLGRITGSIDVEDLLGVIFSEFCVGK